MDLERLYQFRFREIDQTSRERVWKPIVDHVHRLMGRPQKVLDPAAGLGEFIGGVDAGERWAVDTVSHEDAPSFDEVNLIVSDIFEAELPSSHFDGIFVSNFLEHLPDQNAVYRFLSKMNSSMEPGGRIAIMGPNIRYTGGAYWDFADHEVALSHLAIEEHLYMAGFEPRLTIPRYLPYTFRSRLPASPALTSAYLKLKPAWRVLGKQFLVIGEKQTGSAPPQPDPA